MKKSKSQQINSMYLYALSGVSDLSLPELSFEDRLSRNDSLENHQTGYFALLLLLLLLLLQVKPENNIIIIN